MRIRSNHIHNCGHADEMGVCDFAGIHVDTAGMTLPTAQIEANVFRDITAFANGGEGIYLDVSATGNSVSKNLVFDVISSPLFWHVNPGVLMAKDAVGTNISNNVFVQNRGSPFYTGERHHGGVVLEWWGYTKASFNHNVVAVLDRAAKPICPVWWSGAPCAKSEDASKVGPDCKAALLDNFKHVFLGSNVYFNGTGAASATFPGPTAAKDMTVEGDVSFQEWTAPGRDENSLIDVDPGFADPDASDFAVTGAKTLALGIEPLTNWLEQAGATWTPRLTKHPVLEAVLV